MYIPSYYKETSITEIKDFIQHHSFATLVSIKKGRPIASHIPLLLEQAADGDQHFLTGHLAYGNPLWKTFADQEEVLVIFQGPHAYISSSWYSVEEVPTWNYQAVHVYGKAEIMPKEELIASLSHMLTKYEGHRENPVLWHTLSPDLLESELKGIVGFKISINEIQAAYKLSQTRTDHDYHTIIQKLYEEKDVQSHQLAEVMEKAKKK